MNRLGKILTLGLSKKRAWQLPIIAGLLVLFGLGVRWWYNSRAAKGIRLLDMVDSASRALLSFVRIFRRVPA